MPRRMIDPKIWVNLKVGSLSDAGRLLFIGIFSTADDDGRLEADPRFLKATIFPYDQDKTAEAVRKLRDDCVSLGLIRLYSRNGREYLDIPGWHEHQMIRKDRYNPSIHPSFTESDNQPPTTSLPSDNQPPTTGNHSIVKSSIVKSSLEHDTLPNGKVGRSDQYKELFTLWNSLDVIKHKKLTGDMTRAIEATSRDFSVAEISQAMKNYAHIVNDEQCFFKYRWTLQDFLKRGLEKFLDLEVALSNYGRKGPTESAAVKGGYYGTGYKPPKPQGASKAGKAIDAEGEVGATD